MMEQRRNVMPVEVSRGGLRVQVGHGVLPPASEGPVRPGPDRHAIGDRVDPGAERSFELNRPRLADEDEEGRLKRVLDVGAVAEQVAADRQHERPVPGEQRLEGGFVIPSREPLEELTVGHPGEGSAVEDPLNLGEDRAAESVRHGR